MLGSCSVKEDRSCCPCYLEVDCSGLATEFVTLQSWAQREVFTDLIWAPDFGLRHEYRVPRGQIRLTAIGDTGRILIWDEAFYIREGRQMDSLFARSVLLDTRCESVREVLRLNKQFATVTLAFAGSEDGRDGYQLVFLGNVGGVDPVTLEPVQGTFRFAGQPDLAGGFSVRVPRQMDASLVAELYRDGSYVDTVPVGELIEKAGFDWAQEDLGDVRIAADLPACSFTVTVMEWSGPEGMSVII